MLLHTSDKASPYADVVNAREDLWYVENGVLKKHSHITKVMIETENDLELLKDLLPGTVAFLAGYTKSWQKKTDGTWATVTSSAAVVGSAVVGSAIAG